MSSFKDFSVSLLFDVFGPVVKHFEVLANGCSSFFFPLPPKNCDNDYRCIQIELSLKDCDASHCYQLKRINPFPEAHRNTVDSLAATFDVRHKGIIISSIQRYTLCSQFQSDFNPGSKRRARIILRSN